MITEARVPIAAPSANKFGHVSPSQASHVFDDFKTQDILILDGGSCNVGIESTVLKIDEENLHIFRRGGISQQQIQNFLIENGIEMEVKVNKKNYIG